MADLELFAFILGDSPVLRHTFSVTAKASDSVGILKGRIHAKAQGHFPLGASAIGLILWQVLPFYSFSVIIY